MVKGKASEASVHWYFIGFSVFGYFVPLLLTSVLYIFLLHSLWSRKPHSLRSSTPSRIIPPFAYMTPRHRLTNGRSAGGGCYLKTISESAKSKRKVTWMVTAVILTFAVCWLPLNVTFIQTALAYRQNRPVKGSKGQAIFMIFSQVLAYSNSCANPILYAFMSSNFRKGFSRMLSVLACKISTNWNLNNNTNYNTTNNNNHAQHNQNYLLQNSLNTTNTVNNNNSNKNCSNRKIGAKNPLLDEEEEMGRFSPKISSNNVNDGFYQSGTSSTIILVAKSSNSSKQSLLVKRAPPLIVGNSTMNKFFPHPRSSKNNQDDVIVNDRDFIDNQLMHEDDVLL
uniref:G-protein coupled receptors family 1 profile domain-containing protein n=1 Tax=Romanomermis culicivorax TaxID=13658 RepID=A0A915KND2_ROMCU